MTDQSSQSPQYVQTNIPDYQKMLQSSVNIDAGLGANVSHLAQVWNDNVEILTPSPVIQHPQPSISPPLARQRYQTQDLWSKDGRGRNAALSGNQAYLPAKYGVVVDDRYNRDNYIDYQPDPYFAGGGMQESPANSPLLMRQIFNRAPSEHRRSYPEISSGQLLHDHDGYGSAGGGNSSGYGSGGGSYGYQNMRKPTQLKSGEIGEVLGAPKLRSILRNSQSQLNINRDSAVSPTIFLSHHDTQQDRVKKSSHDLRQWQQQHQEELIHQHIETQALFDKQGAPLDHLVRQFGLKDDESSRWEPVRRAADNIIREKNMIIEKHRQHILELEEDLKITNNKLRHAILSTDNKSDVVHQKLKELQYKNATLKTELSETRAKKNAEINGLEERLGATEHEIQLLKVQLKNRDADFASLEGKLQAKEHEVEEWGYRFKDMRNSHQELKQKLDGLERYLADLPTADETSLTRKEMVRLKEEHDQSRLLTEDLQQRLQQTRKLLSARDMHVGELEASEMELRDKVKQLENELQQIRDEHTASQTLLLAQQELHKTKEEKERLATDLEKAKKLLETTHRRLRQTEMRQQSEMAETKERLGQEEEAVVALRQEIFEKEQQIEKIKRLVKELGSQNQDLMEQNLILREQMMQFEQQCTDEGMRLQRRFMTDLGSCFSELQSLVQICLQQARGEDPNLSVLLGIKEAVVELEDAAASKEEEKAQTIKHWLSKLADLRSEMDSLRASICNLYAEDVGKKVECATQ